MRPAAAPTKATAADRPAVPLQFADQRAIIQFPEPGDRRPTRPSPRPFAVGREGDGDDLAPVRLVDPPELLPLARVPDAERPVDRRRRRSGRPVGRRRDGRTRPPWPLRVFNSQPVGAFQMVAICSCRPPAVCRRGCSGSTGSGRGARRARRSPGRSGVEDPTTLPGHRDPVAVGGQVDGQQIGSTPGGIVPSSIAALGLHRGQHLGRCRPSPPGRSRASGGRVPRASSAPGPPRPAA